MIQFNQDGEGVCVKRGSRKKKKRILGSEKRPQFGNL